MHIMIAIDGSTGSKAVVREGLALAHQTGADVTFVAVRATPLPVLGDPYYQRKVSENLAELRPAIVAAVHEADELDIVAEYEILEGNPVEEIVRLARLRDADMIVIGSRARGAVTSAVLGSVSQGVIRSADRPVLVVTPRVEAKASAAA
jgi:nucleotide-binding universal stress UspA family protein